MSGAIDLEDCYRRYGALVYRRCLRLLGSEPQAEDAMQDVFMELLRSHGQLDDRALAGLLFRIATHVSLNRLRTRRRRPEHSDDRLLLMIAHDDALEARTLAEGLLGALFGREPPSTRVMATMHFVDGMTYEEVAREVGMSVSGVRKRLRTLRERAELLRKEDEHGRAA